MTLGDEQSSSSFFIPPGGGPPVRIPRRPRNHLRVLKALADAHAPQDLRYENLPRRSFCVTMDNCLNTIELGPGWDGKNAVLMGWFDAIKFHDEKVMVVEQWMDVVDAKKKVFLERQRVYENHNLAWNALNEDPDEFIMYCNKWKPEFTAIPDIQKHLRHLPDQARERMARDHQRYLEMQDKYEKMIPFEHIVESLKAAHDVASSELDEASRALSKALQEEQAAASVISEDHIIANELGKKLHDIFPTLRTGYLVSKINGVPVEDHEFEVIMEVLQTAIMPHSLEFRRHDFQLNVVEAKWESYQELRETGRYAPDPRFERCVFVEACREGDMGYVRRYLICGADPNSVDYTGCTGMHHAAAQGHLDMMKMLLDNGAAIDARNKNLETPLLTAARKGCMKSVLWLAEHQADMGALDRQRRSPLVHAIRTENVELVRYFLDQGAMVNGGDIQWGWTSLHYAASVGNMDIVRLLIERRANKYKVTKTNMTAEEVAGQCHRHAAQAYLRQLVFEDPAQRMLWNDENGLQVWVGAKAAAHPSFATPLGLDAFLVLNDHGLKDPSTAWLDKEAAMGNVQHMAVGFRVSDEDKTERSFRELLLRLRPLLDFVVECLEQNRRLLICCDTGVSTAPSLLLAFLLLKRRYRLLPVLQHMQRIRRQVQPSVSMWKGLQGLEDGLDKRKLQRLAQRVHNCQLLDLVPFDNE